MSEILMGYIILPPAQGVLNKLGNVGRDNNLRINNAYLFYGSEIKFLTALKEPDMNNPR
jgi:hypothetical protein